MTKKETKQIAETSKNSQGCDDIQCPVHGSLKVRGRTFKGYVIKKFDKRIAIEFERVIYIAKYERYMSKKTRIHARLPKCSQEKVQIGDYVSIGECRPLSKIIHFVYLNTIRHAGEKTE